ncbi:WxL domain-containing protein [Enterococcus faecalis]|uniref:WxL domain-containing protein n=1 Tax=Enterococcus faecalis TaxID=1351 RepID=UPI001AD62C4D|nr:WxL domain-containing protein [Enterococcus faecalis]MBO6390843.1 WxL domain-containing protein [Enterococcus faecalis]MBO6451169.1 WxL domain-containing protein [Enterococcus faecalis]MBO6462682.1 WxL domain-containing protein [Enterococcus faecalis]MBO6472590.1 WxL domain-containing protein [Enterococcus faecalis]MBO6477834.1 WxL domain-containing protein [Enterococcus faecalis]
MKQTKWQRLATIGLCSSLVINAFSGVTAVAETITIESSPTVASSAKEATSASSATPESTESSQETTETSREEVTQETVEQEDTTEIAQEENLLEPSGIQAKIMPRAFVWAATGTTNRTTVRLNDVVDYRMKLENITTDDTNSDIVGPIRIESKLAAGMTRPTSVIIKVGPEEQNVVIGEGSHNANSGGEYFVWTESTRTVTAFINRLHGRTSGNTGYIKTLYFQTRITSGTHNEKKYIDSTIRFNGFGAVNRRNEMTYVDRFSGNLGLKGNLKFYDEDGVASKEQMSLSINPVLFKSTNSRVEGTLLRYPLTMTNAGSGLYRFDTGLKNIGTSNGGSWFFFSNDIVINFATATTNRIDKIVLAPPKATLPDSRTGVMTSRAYTSTTYTRSNYDISTYNFTKATGKTWRITNRSSNSGVSTNIMFSDNLVGTTGQFNKGNSGATINYYIYYKKLYENFVNSNGQKITPPSGFTQGKRTVINSEAYTFKQSGTLPDTYKVGTKTYQFKGWYKGKNKPDTLTTTKAPSYPVTYNDDDDLTVVYEEVVMKTYNLPAKDVYFGYVDEAGNLLNTAGFSVEAELGESDETESTVLGKIQGTDEVMSKLKKLSIPGKSYDFPIDKLKTYGARSVNHTIPKQYKTMSITPLATYTGDKTKYPMTKEIRKNIEAPYTVVSQADGVEAFKLTNAGTFFRTRRAFWTWDPNNTLYAMGIYSGTVGKNYNLASPEGTIYYYLENRRVTENFVDPSGAKITPPTGFTQGKQTVIDSDNFTYASTKALPDTYTTGDKSYKFKGWYKGKTKPGTLTTTKTPSYAVTYDDKDDMTAVYEEVQPTAEMTVSRLLEVIPNEASMMWIVKLKNTSEVPLTNVKLAPTVKWAAGISPPTQLAVRIGNTPNKIIPVTAEQWQAGVNLDIEIPVNGEALVTVNTAKITGEPRQLLTAEMTASGNFSAVTASNFVRIQGEDQTITPTPVEEGFISTPTFDFGKITINSSTKQYGLKKAADYYGNGTRNPYLRIKTSQPNWQLTAQLSQLTASADSLPTSTRLLLGSADVIAIENYNQVTELTNKVGVTKALTLTSDGTSTPVILNNQFTGNDVYQLDFDFANVKLEVPANQGKINEKYQGTVTWNLVTGP